MTTVHELEQRVTELEHLLGQLRGEAGGGSGVLRQLTDGLHTALHGHYVARFPCQTDFSQADLTMDAAFHVLDLSSVVTDDDAYAVHLFSVIGDATVGASLGFRHPDDTKMRQTFYTQVANNFIATQAIIPLTADKEIQYYASEALSVVVIRVLGWWRGGKG